MYNIYMRVHVHSHMLYVYTVGCTVVQDEVEGSSLQQGKGGADHALLYPSVDRGYGCYRGAEMVRTLLTT